MDDRLQTAYAEFTKLCRTHKIRISFCMWTKFGMMCVFRCMVLVKCIYIPYSHSLSDVPKETVDNSTSCCWAGKCAGVCDCVQGEHFFMSVSLILHKYT